MKQLFSICLMALFLVNATACKAQTDKAKRPSPPVVVTQKVGELTLSIDYSQPAIKGRTIGKDIEPKDGVVWRTGANEATVFEVDGNVMVEGKPLPKGKYGLFTLVNGDQWTIIFNNTWKQWGAYDYKEADDALRINVKAGTAVPFAEKMTFSIDDTGTVVLLWGDKKIAFTVK